MGREDILLTNSINLNGYSTKYGTLKSELKSYAKGNKICSFLVHQNSLDFPHCL